MVREIGFENTISNYYCSLNCFELRHDKQQQLIKLLYDKVKEMNLVQKKHNIPLVEKQDICRN